MHLVIPLIENTFNKSNFHHISQKGFFFPSLFNSEWRWGNSVLVCFLFSIYIREHMFSFLCEWEFLLLKHLIQQEGKANDFLGSSDRWTLSFPVVKIYLSMYYSEDCEHVYVTWYSHNMPVHVIPMCLYSINMCIYYRYMEYLKFC